MSERAVLAHEYYGHRPYREQYLSLWEQGKRQVVWSDEFRASYMAAINAPGLTDVERRDLMLDAIERAREEKLVPFFYVIFC